MGFFKDEVYFICRKANALVFIGTLQRLKLANSEAYSRALDIVNIPWVMHYIPISDKRPPHKQPLLSDQSRPLFLQPDPDLSDEDV